MEVRLARTEVVTVLGHVLCRLELRLWKPLGKDKIQKSVKILTKVKSGGGGGGIELGSFSSAKRLHTTCKLQLSNSLANTCCMASVNTAICL